MLRPKRDCGTTGVFLARLERGLVSEALGGKVARVSPLPEEQTELYGNEITAKTQHPTAAS